MSRYRDDREALRQQKEALAEELETTEEDLAEAKDDLAGAKSDLEAKDEELERLRKQLGDRQPGRFDQTATTARQSFLVRYAVWLVLGSIVLFVVGAIGVSVATSDAGEDLAAITRGAVLDARVTEGSNHPSVASGSTCTVKISPHSARLSRFNCRVRVECPKAVIYGNEHGYCTCTERDGLVDSASDPWPDDGDPAVSVDVDLGRATVSTPTWQVSMELITAPPPTGDGASL